MNEKLSSFEKLLACHCAPTLKGKKAGSMFHLPLAQCIYYMDCITHFNSIYNKEGMFLRVMSGKKHRMTIYVYRLKLLLKILENEEVSSFLSQYKYPGKIIQQLDYLDEKIKEEEYPHEIGIFLGYPIWDVKGFIEKKKCVHCGMWRVYEREEESKKLFEEYENNKKELLYLLGKGYHLQQIL